MSLGHVQLFVAPWAIACQAHPWNSPGKNAGVGCHSLLQEIFPTQGSNPSLLHWQVDPLPSELPGKPFVHTLECIAVDGSLRTIIFP